VYSLRDALPRLRFVAAAVRRAADGDEALARAEPTFLLAEGTAIEDSGPETEGVKGEITTLEESPGRIRMIATASGPTAVVVRDSFAPGWRARVNGEAAPVRRADGRHLAVRIPAGKSEVSLRYIPPHLRPGLLLSAGAALVTLALWSLGRRRRTVAL
jgi:Bacterial membrane protein YfhO